MNISFSHIDNVKHIKMLSASSTYGVGFFTSISVGFCNIFGLECKMYGKKIEKAKSSAACKLIEKAAAIGAMGIMDVQFQITGTTVFMYGIAYSEN